MGQILDSFHRSHHYGPPTSKTLPCKPTTMNKLNTGPSTKPWGTLLVVNLQLDSVPLSTTIWTLTYSQLSIYFTVQSSRLHFLSAVVFVVINLGHLSISKCYDSVLFLQFLKRPEVEYILLNVHSRNKASASVFQL